MTTDETITQSIDRIVKAANPTKVILFGSRARGDGDERSDIDLLVVCPFIGSRRSIMSALLRTMEGLGAPFDIVVLSPEEFEIDRQIPGTVARPAWLEGVVLYESN